MLGTVLLVAGLLRFVGLGRFPLGIHGEENVWTWQVATVLFSDERPWPTTWYFAGVPVSYFQEWPFFKLFGLNYIAPRYEVAFFGTVAVGLFYILAKKLTSTRPALLATVLLATSMVGLASSRGAFVQSHVLFWTILAYLLYISAVDSRRLSLFLLTGGALALGLLTYQTFATALAVIALHFTWGMWERRREWKTHLTSAALLSAPVLVIWPRAWEYLESQRPHVTGSEASLTNIQGGFLDNPAGYIGGLWDNITTLLSDAFYRQVYADYLVHRPSGPVVLAAVTALLLAGLVYLLVHFRHRGYQFVMLWFALQFFFSPLILGAPFIRATLPAYPALYLIAAVGFIAIVSCFSPRFSVLRPAFGAIAVAVVVMIGATGATAYFHETLDTDGRDRRELSDQLASLTENSTRVLLPYVPDSGDPLEFERYNIRFVVAGAVGGFSEADRYYRLIQIEEVLPEIQSGDPHIPKVAVIYRPAAPNISEARRTQVLAAIKACYPNAQHEQGEYFTTLLVPSWQDSLCRAGVRVEPVEVWDQIAASEAPVFSWRVSERVDSFDLHVEQQRRGVRFMEMETFAQPAWPAEGKSASDFTGAGYLYHEVDAGDASIALDVPEEGAYTLWLRTYRSIIDEARHYVTIDGGPRAEVSPPAGVPLNEWVWERYAPFVLTRGRHDLVLSHEGTGATLFFDSMYLSSGADFDPRKDSAWLLVTQVEIKSEREGKTYSYRLTRPLSPGEYRWWVRATGEHVVDGLGHPGIAFEPIYFMVTPSQR